MAQDAHQEGKASRSNRARIFLLHSRLLQKHKPPGGEAHGFLFFFIFIVGRVVPLVPARPGARMRNP